MWKGITAENPAIFRSYITHGNMMAFAAFLALLNLREAASRGARLAWGLFALLGVINVLFMVQGRTGYMIMMALLAWFAWATLSRIMRRRGMPWDWRHGVAVALIFAGVAAAAYHASLALHEG